MTAVQLKALKVLCHPVCNACCAVNILKANRHASPVMECWEFLKVYLKVRSLNVTILASHEQTQALPPNHHNTDPLGFLRPPPSPNVDHSLGQPLQIKHDIQFVSNLYGLHEVYVPSLFYLQPDSLEYWLDEQYRLARSPLPSSASLDRQFWHPQFAHLWAVLPAY